MLNVTDLWLKDVVLYKKVHIPINKNNGFVVITGHNRDSRISGEQNNGAGKSLLLSAIPNLRYASAPLSTAKNSKKDMLDSTQSMIRMAFENNEGNLVRITQNPKKWIIEEYDSNKELYVDQQVHRLIEQQSKLEDHFPISESEFYSYVYVQSQLKLDFQVGKPLDRLKFITDVFHLSEYDAIKKYFTQMLGRIKDEQTKFDVIQSKLIGVVTTLDKLKWNGKKQSDLELAKERLESVKTAHIDLGREISKAKSTYRGLKSLVALKEEETKIKEKDKYITDFIKEKGGVDAAVVYFKQQIDLLHKTENYSIQLAAAKKQRRRVLAKLDELRAQNIPSLTVLKKEKTKYQDQLDKLQGNKRRYESHLENIDRLKTKKERSLQLLQELGFDSIDDVDTKIDIDEDMSICKTTIRLERLLNSGDHVCPTCLQDVDIDTIESNVKKANIKLTKLRTLEKARQFRADYLESMETLEEDNTDLSAESIALIDNKIKSSKRRLESIEKHMALCGKVKDLEEDLKSIEKPKAPAENPDEGIDLVSAKNALDVCNHLGKIAHSIANVYQAHNSLKKLLKEKGIEAAFEEIQEELNTNMLHYDDLSEEQTELIRYVSKMDMKFGEYRILTKQRTEYETEMEEIKPLLEKRDMYKALEQAYGSKGLKVERADEIVTILEANLNQYSHFIFAEPFSFRVYANDSGIHCEVDRGNGKPSDVKLLSGAESDCFRMLFMLSMLVMVPHTRRTNFVVLDEPDSHMDTATKELFKDSFLPYLREVVPHVFLITPLDPHFYSDFEHWEVVKENGISTVRRAG